MQRIQSVNNPQCKANRLLEGDWQAMGSMPNILAILSTVAMFAFATVSQADTPRQDEHGIYEIDVYRNYEKSNAGFQKVSRRYRPRFRYYGHRGFRNRGFGHRGFKRRGFAHSYNRSYYNRGRFFHRGFGNRHGYRGSY